MKVKNRMLAAFLIFLALFVQTPASASVTQVIQLNTNFRSIAGKASWLLIVRNEETGQVTPYLFDITKKDNFWLVFTYGRAYRITASKLTMGPLAVVRNFCNLENGIITGKSMMVTLTGDLTPLPTTYKCAVKSFEDAGAVSAYVH